MPNESYQSLGVSATKDEVHSVVDQMDHGLFPGAFCKILPDILGNDPEQCLIMHADGAGTKSSLAYLAWKETGDTSWFKGIATDSLIMNLDDLICVGAIDQFVLSNTIGRNAHRIPGSIIKEVITGYMDDIARLKAHGIQIEMAGGETADVGDLVQTIIVDSTLSVRLPRKNVIDCQKIQEGDVIVGFSSTGQASYEKRPNSGIGSNGLTSARHEVLSKVYAEKYPESYSPTIPEANVFRGKYLLSDRVNNDFTVAEALLSPTRTYAPLLQRVFKQIGTDALHGIIHCTGGGQQKCRNFGNQIRYIKENLFSIPPLFQMIRDLEYVSLNEMYKVFNMGHLLEVICPAKFADELIKIANEFNIKAQIVGHCEKSAGKNEVLVKTEGKEFSYQ